MFQKRRFFVMDGIRPNLYSPKSLQESHGSYYDIMRQYFIKIATIKGYEVLDMQPYFIKTHQENNTTFEYPTDNHWNKNGHKLVAEKIANTKVYKELFKK